MSVVWSTRQALSRDAHERQCCLLATCFEDRGLCSVLSSTWRHTALPFSLVSVRESCAWVLLVHCLRAVGASLSSQFCFLNFQMSSSLKGRVSELQLSAMDQKVQVKRLESEKQELKEQLELQQR